MEIAMEIRKCLNWLSDRLKLQDYRIKHVVMLLLIVLCSILYYGYANLNLDDSFIHLRIARNVAEGYGPVWNIGDKFYNATSPLWVMILSISFILDIDPIFYAILIYYLFLLFSSFLLFLLIEESNIKEFSPLAPIIIFLSPIGFQFIGMETALLVFLLLLLTYLYIKGYSLNLIMFLGGLLVLVRGEGIIFVLLILLDFLFLNKFRNYQGKNSLFIKVKRLLLPILFFLLPLVSCYLYIYIKTSAFLPVTLKAKILQGKSGLFWQPYYKKIFSIILETLNNNPVALTFASLGLFQIIQNTGFILILLFVIIQSIAYSIMQVAGYGWYYYGVILITNICFWLGFAYMFKYLYNSVKNKAFLIKSIYIFTVIYSSFYYCKPYIIPLKHNLGIPIQDRKDSRRIAYEDISEYLKRISDNVENKTVLTDEIGILGYYLKDFRIYDELGLTDPEFTIEKIHNWDFYVQKFEPYFLVRNYIPNQPEILCFSFNNSTIFYKKIYTANSTFPSQLYIKYYQFSNRNLEDFKFRFHSWKEFELNIHTEYFTLKSLKIYKDNYDKNIYLFIYEFYPNKIPIKEQYEFFEHFLYEGTQFLPRGCLPKIPTSEWYKFNKVEIVTAHKLFPGNYHLFIGFVIPKTQSRLKVGTSDDRIFIGQIEFPK